MQKKLYMEWMEKTLMGKDLLSNGPKENPEEAEVLEDMIEGEVEEDLLKEVITVLLFLIFLIGVTGQN